MPGRRPGTPSRRSRATSFQRHGPEGGRTDRDAESLLTELIERTPAVVEAARKELQKGFSDQVADSVLGGLITRTLEAMSPA